MNESGSITNVYVPASIGFFALLVGIAIFIILKNYTELSEFEYEREAKKIKDKGLEIINADTDILSLSTMLTDNSFKKEGNFFLKNKLFLSNGLIRLIIGIEQTSNVEKGLKKMIEDAGKVSEKSDKIVFLRPAEHLVTILFVDEITQKIQDVLLDMQLSFKYLNTVSKRNLANVVLILYDKKEKCFAFGYGRKKLSSNQYDKTIRFIKNMLVKANIIK
ncbi:MAG: hypothetical protein EOM87_04445 [Clostridia bacterium]|nr:hypothetical protein [Clostridia bacterium]